MARSPSRSRQPLPSFEIDPAHAGPAEGGPRRIGIAYAFNEALAIPNPYRDPSEPAPKVPAHFRSKVPVLLDLTSTTQGMVIGERSLPIASIEIISGDRTRRLASFRVGIDCAVSRTWKVEQWTDRGTVHEDITHLRMALPPTLTKPLFARPAQELLVVALDEQGRTVTVQTISGRARDDALLVDGRLLSCTKDHRYGGEERFCDWTFAGTLAFDELIHQPRKTDTRSRAVIPPRAKRRQPMVLDLSCTIPHSFVTDRPLKAISTVYVFDSDDVLLQRLPAKQGVYSQGTDQGWGADTSTYRYEHLRIGMAEALAAPLRRDSERSLHIIAVDARFRTVMVAFPSCYPRAAPAAAT